MSLQSGERSLHVTQIAKETTPGIAVPTTVILNNESSAIIELDRSPAAPQLDYGGLSRHRPARGMYGVKGATMTMRSVVDFETVMYYLRHGFAGGVSPTGAGPYTWLHVNDETSDTIETATIEEGDNLQAYRMKYGLVTEYRVSFSELAAPGNSMWQLETAWLGQDKEAVTLTAGASAIAGAEEAMGHLTKAYLGSTSTAFASLTEQVGILAYSGTFPTGVVARKQGGTTDTFDFHGRNQHEPTATSTFYQTASTKTALWDVFNASGPQMSEKRLRIEASGSGTKKFIIDGRVRLRTVPINESNGATVYAASLEYVYDATLGSDLGITVINSVAGPLL